MLCERMTPGYPNYLCSGPLDIMSREVVLESYVFTHRSRLGREKKICMPLHSCCS